jgi:hypothetical protein
MLQKTSQKTKIEAAQTHGCQSTSGCGGCPGFFRGMINQKARDGYVLQAGGAENAEKIINAKAATMRAKNPNSKEEYDESVSEAFNKYLEAAGIEGGTKNKVVSLEEDKNKQTNIDKAALNYIAAAKGKHWR